MSSQHTIPDGPLLGKGAISTKHNTPRVAFIPTFEGADSLLIKLEAASP